MDKNTIATLEDSHLRNYFYRLAQEVTAELSQEHDVLDDNYVYEEVLEQIVSYLSSEGEKAVLMLLYDYAEDVILPEFE